MYDTVVCIKLLAVSGFNINALRHTAASYIDKKPIPETPIK